jgi:hypothetical protein
MTYPGSAHIGKLPELPLKVGDTWEEAGSDGDRIFSWQLTTPSRANSLERQIDTGTRGA